jgi:hypothetical protein
LHVTNKGAIKNQPQHKQEGLTKMAYNLYTESLEIAKQVLEDSQGDFSDAQDLLLELCDSHEISIYFGKAIQFCADVNTSGGEAYLEDCGGIVQRGDSFSQIACRVAWATLYCAAQERLSELEQESE